MPPLSPLAQRTRVLQLVWAAFVVAIAAYWLLEIVLTQWVLRPSVALPLLGQGVILLALATYGMAWWWFRWTTDRVIQQLRADRPDRLTEPHRQELASRAQAAVIGCLAFLEAPVIYGLVHSLINAAYPALFDWLALASLAGMVTVRVLAFPIAVELLKRLERPAGRAR
jgi:hypothetical protein